VVEGHYPSSHDVACLIAAHLGVEADLTGGTDAGPGYDERQATHAAMVAQGLQPHILLTKERFRFLRKANRNNRLSVEALLATGFSFEHTDLEASVGETIGWYRQHRWIL